MRRKIFIRMISGVLLFLLWIRGVLWAEENLLTPEDLLSLRRVTSGRLSPDGEWIAYTLRVPRSADDEPGSAYSELYLIPSLGGESRPFVTGKVNVGQIGWHPDGGLISFRARKDGNKRNKIYVIPIDGGESYPLFESDYNIHAYAWHPQDQKILFTAAEPETEKDKQLREKGYDFVYFEEEWRHINLYEYDLTRDSIRQITRNITVWEAQYSPDGKNIFARVAEANLIDYRYMFSFIASINPHSGEIRKISANEGKLGNFALSPDSRYLAYTAALHLHDSDVSQIFLLDLQNDSMKHRNLTIEKYRGHVHEVTWKDRNTLVYHASEGVQSAFYTYDVRNDQRKLLLHSKETGYVFKKPFFNAKGEKMVFLAESSYFPTELFIMEAKGTTMRLTDSNPWLSRRKLGRQQIIRYKARDGLTIEGLLIYPVHYKQGRRYPLVVYVHGGPEAHYSNGWLSNYFSPGQVLAGGDYLVFYPNYRSSTGYGVDFAMQGFGDPAGKEFDDIADGIRYLVRQGLADSQRVGVAGGSYGGYATAWFATYYTHLTKAGCMFVGISDLISKKGTTDIPNEEILVHAGKPLEEIWDLALRRSPIYYAQQSKTALLILGGSEDTRVHPSQSIEMYRAFKRNGKTVRLVQYPGEGHGNRKQPGRIDVLYRTLDWWQWYLKEDHAVDGPMPPFDISEKYGIDLSQ